MTDNQHDKKAVAEMLIGLRFEKKVIKKIWNIEKVSERKC